MKTLPFIISSILIYSCFACYKEEMPPASVTTIIDIKLINHHTQLPIENAKISFAEKIDATDPGDWWGWITYDRVTDENGIINFERTSTDSYSDLILIHPSYSNSSLHNSYKKDSVFINGVLDREQRYDYDFSDGRFFYLGIGVREGLNYTFDIELIHN